MDDFKTREEETQRIMKTLTDDLKAREEEVEKYKQRFGVSKDRPSNPEGVSAYFERIVSDSKSLSLLVFSDCSHSLSFALNATTVLLEEVAELAVLRFWDFVAYTGTVSEVAQVHLCSLTNTTAVVWGTVKEKSTEVLAVIQEHCTSLYTTTSGLVDSTQTRFLGESPASLLAVVKTKLADTLKSLSEFFLSTHTSAKALLAPYKPTIAAIARGIGGVREEEVMEAIPFIFPLFFITLTILYLLPRSCEGLTRLFVHTTLWLWCSGFTIAWALDFTSVWALLRYCSQNAFLSSLVALSLWYTTLTLLSLVATIRSNSLRNRLSLCGCTVVLLQWVVWVHRPLHANVDNYPRYFHTVIHISSLAVIVIFSHLCPPTYAPPPPREVRATRVKAKD